MDSTFSFKDCQRPQKASNSQEWLGKHTGVSWGSPNQCVWSMGRAMELMPLDYTPPSLRTTVGMGGILLEIQWTVWSHAWLADDGSWHHLSLSDYSTVPKGQTHAKENCFILFYYFLETFWGCCIRGADKSEETSRWGRQSELINQSSYW